MKNRARGKKNRVWPQGRNGSGSLLTPGGSPSAKSRGKVASVGPTLPNKKEEENIDKSVVPINIK